jgi:PKD repeat protein
VRRCGVGEVPLSCTPGDSKDFIIWWDKPTGGKMIGTGKDILSPFIYKTDSFYVEAARIASVAVLQNGMNGGTIISGDMTSYNGGYFDLTTGASTLALDSMTFRLWQAYSNSSYQLYYRVGGFAGYEKDATAWTLISQGVGKYTATGNLITVDNIGLILSPNTKYAFYFTTDPSTQGNDVYLNSGAITKSNSDLSWTGGACNWGLFGSNGIYTTWTIDVRIGYKKSCPSPGRGKVVVTIIPSPTGATLLQGSSFNGVYNAGTLKNPDMVAETRTINYELRPPTKFSNATYGTDWFISGLSMGTINGTPIPTGDTTMSPPSAAGNGTLSYTPSPGWEDSTIHIVVNIYDVSVACDSIIQRHIFVAPTPRPNFNGQDVCLGTAMEFVNKSSISSGFMTYFWDFDDGTTSDFEAPIHLFTRSGLFRVRLTATSDLGIVNDTVIDINVFEIPDIRFTVSNQCEGIAVKFNNTTTISSGILSYKWDFGDGSTDNATSPSHLYAKAGGYKVTLVAEANGCQSTLTKNASQFARPKAAFTNSGDCNGKEVSFNNTSTIGLGEKIGTQWFYGDGNHGTQANQKHIYTNAGTMSVKMIAVSQFGCKDSLTKNLVIKPSPVADFSYDKICDVDPVNFNNTSTEPAGVSVIYNWEFGDGAVSTQKNPTHKYNTLGPKRITLMATGANGCFTQIDKDVEVLVQPVANFEVSNGCAGEQINFVNKSTVSKGDMLYNWTFGDGNSTNVASPKKKYNPTVSTTYVVVLETNVIGGCSDKITKSVDIKEQPTCGFTAKVSSTDRRTWTFTPNNNSYGPNAYTWVFEGSGVSTDVSPTHTFDYYDFQYRVIMRVKTPDGCECLDSNYTLTTAWGVGMKDQKLSDGMKLYPNPSTGVVTLELSDWTLTEQATVTVFDATGREVKIIDMAAAKQVIDLDDMANGIYSLRVDRRNSKRPSRTTRIILRR